MEFIIVLAVTVLATIGLAFAYGKGRRSAPITPAPSPVADLLVDAKGTAAAVTGAEPLSGTADVRTVSMARGGGSGTPAYFLTPSASSTAVIEKLLTAGWYAWGENTPGRKGLRPGDGLCIYETTNGVVAEAEVAGTPERGVVEGIAYNHANFPWRFRVRNARFFFGRPVVIDAALRSQLDAFHGTDGGTRWSWFVQVTRPVTEHDFAVLTGISIPRL